MKKVLAIVLAVVMVCTMALAVDIKPTDKEAVTGGSTPGTVKVLGNIKPGETVKVVLQKGSGENATDVDYYTKDDKFVPANNVVTVTFAKGAEYVQSQGWVKVVNDNGADKATSYEYQIKFKSDLSKVADPEAAEIQISAITFKATGYNLVTLHKATKTEENLGYSYGYTKTPLNITVGSDSTTGYAPVPGNVNVVETLSDGKKEVNTLEVVDGVMTYTLNKGMKIYKMDTTEVVKTSFVPATAENGDKGYTGTKDFCAPITNTLNLAAKAEVALGANANNTYKVYAKTADGKVLSVAATNNDGVLSFTVPAMSTFVITEDTLTTSGSTGTTTGTTTNPGTGANDVVGVAAALAVVALVSGAAISLKK